MSLQKRLNLSFMAMIIIPCILFSFAVLLLFFTFSGQEGRMNSTVQLENIEKKNLIFTDMKLMTTAKPASFYDENFLNKRALELEELNIALFIRINDEITYNSKLFNDQPIKLSLTPFGEFVSHVHDSIKIGEESYKFEQHDFYFPDQSKGSIFLVKEASFFEQFASRFLPFLLILLIVILVSTNGTLSYLVSRSILKPLKALQHATENIKSGNLDFKIEVERKDEIGNLTKDFESMRLKLKEAVEVQHQYEENRKLLISNISHDLKTPITSIKGYVEGIRDGVANTEEKQQKYVNTIYKKAVEMDSLIDELFLFSTLDLRHVPFYFEKMNIVNFIKESIDDLSYDLEKNGFQIQFYNELGSNVYVKADREKLMRVFNNIIQNSVKYLEKEKGQILISVRETEEFLFVKIEDNGSGISSEDLPHIFKSFYRADKSRNSKTGGTGLGLAISKQIIEAHGGMIWAESGAEETGTVINFSLQMADKNEDQK
ncbi:HAMP domain-containing sensor histidine kinase [Bacillaceae bacterium IKA-2]|nr:HAMP domain-containing sensor histidine kinase [Bacillaceae bacterium IKA-2]